MQPTRKPASRTKIILMWLVLLGNFAFWIGFWIWRSRGRAMPADESGPDFVKSIFYFIVGGFFLAMGIAGYCIVIFTQCLTFNFHYPVWKNLKPKKYLANIIVPLLVALGLGFMLAAFLSPVLQGAGLSPQLASLLPVLGMVMLLQIFQLFVMVWSPVERRIITKRLAALGLQKEQLQSGTFVGLSDPARSSFKKFGGVEEDMGVLWITADQIIFWGDSEQFSIARQQLLSLEQKADTGGTTMLFGATHPILHILLPNGAERQIRLHVEGVWTMAQKRRGLDQLAESISAWHGAAAQQAAPAAQG